MTVSAVEPIGVALSSSLTQSSQLRGGEEAGLVVAGGLSTPGDKATAADDKAAAADDKAAAGVVGVLQWHRAPNSSRALGAGHKQGRKQRSTGQPRHRRERK